MPAEAEEDSDDKEESVFPFAKFSGIMLWLIAIALALGMVYHYATSKKAEDSLAEPQEASDYYGSSYDTA